MIHLFSTYTKDWQPLVDLVKPLWQEYADRHECGLLFKELEPLFPQHYSFTKTRAVRAAVEKTILGESVFVIDMDMIPTNMAYELESTVVKARFPSCGIVMGKDVHGWNSGAYFIDNNPWALAWLDCIVNFRVDLTSEQHAMWRINDPFGVAEAEGINSIPYEAYEGFGFAKKNHYSQWGPGHFISHLPGMTMAERIRILKTYVPQIIR